MSEVNISELILAELKDTRREMNEGFSETKQRITALETNVAPFFANGGGKDQIDEDIESLKRTKYYVLGGAGVLSGLMHTVFKKLGL